MEGSIWVMQLMGALRPWALLLQVLVLIAVLVGDLEVRKRILRGAKTISWQGKKGARHA